MIMKDGRTTAMAQRGILTREQLAEELNLSEQTIRNWERGGMPAIREGKTVLYHVPAVIKWLLRRKKK